MKVSIITPSFNQGSYLEQTIDSVLSQRNVSIEYIIIDGGSTDDSIEIIKKHKKHLAFWVSEPDFGQSHAINKGLRHVTGDVVNWLNSDDYLEPGALEIVSEHFTDPALHVLTGRSNIVKAGRVLRQSSGTDVYGDNIAKTLGWARIDQPETFFRSVILRSLGPLDERLHFIMDKELWMRYLIRYGTSQVRKISSILANFRLHENSKTQRQLSQFSLESNAVMLTFALSNHLENHAALIRKIPPFVPPGTDLPGYNLETPEDLAKKVLDYFLLYKADESYYADSHTLCRDLLASLDQANLQADDLALFKKLRVRSRYAPIFLKKLLRKWK